MSKKNSGFTIKNPKVKDVIKILNKCDPEAFFCISEPGFFGETFITAGGIVEYDNKLFILDNGNEENGKIVVIKESIQND